MAATNDPNAHLMSIPLKPDSIDMLNGQRYSKRSNFNANQDYKVPANIFNGFLNAMPNGTVTDDFKQFIEYYIKDHFTYQLPRILTLQRYYLADNDIHYWASDKLNRADNRIASANARYITDFNNGLMLGKPIKYGYSNPDVKTDDGADLISKITNFDASNDEPYHEKVMGKNMFNTGRAYELYYVDQGTNDLRITPINPNTCFVIYSTDVDSVELVGVRYYLVNVAGNTDYQVEVYTKNYTYYFDGGQDPTSTLDLIKTAPNQFSDVPITEYRLNDEKVGLWEPVIDNIDAIDKAMSEMANSEEDFSNSTLVVSGDIDVPPEFIQLQDGNGDLLYHDRDHVGEFTTNPKDSNGNGNNPVMVRNSVNTKGNLMILKPSQVSSGTTTTSVPVSAKYLTKSLDVNEWKTYVEQQLHDIHQFTLTPDLSDQNFAGQQTGAAMAYKLLSSLTSFTGFESFFRRGLMRRLKLLTAYWSQLPNSQGGITSSDNQNDPTKVTIQFTANLPTNIQDTIQKLQVMIQGNASGDNSKQTYREALADLTGVSADEESTRVEDEQKQSNQGNVNQVNQIYNMMKNSKLGNNDPNGNNDGNQNNSDPNGDGSDCNQDGKKSNPDDD